MVLPWRRWFGARTIIRTGTGIIVAMFGGLAFAAIVLLWRYRLWGFGTLLTIYIIVPILFRRCCIPSSLEHLGEAERVLLAELDRSHPHIACKQLEITFDTGSSIHSSVFSRQKCDSSGTEPTPNSGQPKVLLLVHGYGAGGALWLKCIREFFPRTPVPGEYQQVHTIDLPGFGLSSFNGPSAPAKVLDHWVAAVDAWRVSTGVTDFHILGHSLGTYVAMGYFNRHPQHVSHIALAAPVGLNIRTVLQGRLSARGRWLATVLLQWLHIGRKTLVGLCGPYGKPMLARILHARRSWYGFSTDSEIDYVYHLCASPNGGELMFMRLISFMKCDWAMPIDAEFRKLQVSHGIPCSLIYGDQDGLTDSRDGDEMSSISTSCRVLHLRDCGHHMYNTASAEMCSFLKSR